MPFLTSGILFILISEIMVQNNEICYYSLSYINEFNFENGNLNIIY